jgi:hypothetical protein
MSSQRASSHAPSQQERDSVDTINDQDKNPEQHMSTVVSQLPTTSLAGCGEPTSPSTKVLHAPTNNSQPTITLTTYKDDGASPGLSTPSISVLHLFKPDPSPYVSGASNSAAVALADDDEIPALRQLKEELEVCFLEMRSEFEERTGRGWVPLRAWPREEWEWEGLLGLGLEGEEEEEEEDV